MDVANAAMLLIVVAYQPTRQGSKLSMTSHCLSPRQGLLDKQATVVNFAPVPTFGIAIC
jgi:hypothetical protein